MADVVAMLQSVLDPEMPLSERAAIKAAIDEIERLRAERDKYLHTLHAAADFGNRDILRPYVTAAGIEARRG